MFLVNFLPNWVFHIVAVAGLAGLIASNFFKVNKIAIQAASAALLAFGLYLSGAASNNDEWLFKVKQLEVKLAEAEAQSAKENVKIVEKVATKIQIVKMRGDDIIQYVDREVAKHDSSCVIPQEFVTAHNRAAEAPAK